MSVPALTLGVQAVGVGASLLGSSRRADASEAAIPFIQESAEIRRQAGDVEQQAIEQRNTADVDAALYRASVARDNRVLTDVSAADAIARGEADAVLEQHRVEQVIGEQRATLAANGVVVDVGSALDLVSDTIRTGKINQLRIKSNSEREALALRQAGKNFEAEAILLEDTAGSILKGTPLELEGSRLRTEADILATLSKIDVASASADASRLSGIGTALGGIGNVASRWDTFRRAGAFG